ncbi:MAG TPA: hypothetical protein VF731_05100 [Solirubrobacterales bacterium]
MKHRRLFGCVLLAGALMSCALIAQSATAATNLTAFTCVNGEGSLDFSDSHCDHTVEKLGTGEYGHVAIPAGKVTEVENVSTTVAILKSSALGITTEIKCNKTHGSGTFQNEEVGGGFTGSGTGSTEFSECTVAQPPGCTVQEPIKTVKLRAEPVEEGSKMGGKITPAEGTTFTVITLANCGLLNGEKSIQGSATAVGGAGATAKGTGATAVYLPENEHLTFADRPPP